MDLAIVVAMSRTGLIGRNGGLPWRLPRDLKHFRQLTWGKPILMGRRTHESLGRPLPGRTNIVLSRSDGFQLEGCQVARSGDEAVTMARETGAAEAMIIGGAGVFKELLPLCQTAHVTLVEGDFVGDVHFPGPLLDAPEWMLERKESWPADENNPHEATYFLLRRPNQRGRR